MPTASKPYISPNFTADQTLEDRYDGVRSRRMPEFSEAVGREIEALAQRRYRMSAMQLSDGLFEDVVDLVFAPEDDDEPAPRRADNRLSARQLGVGVGICNR